MIFGVSVALLAAAWAFQMVFVDELSAGRLGPAFFGYLLALTFYGTVVYLFGFSGRLLQTQSAIIACGSILALVSRAEYVVFAPLLGQETAGALSLLIWMWSVPVKGHVIAQAIQRHWFVGITIAVAAFIMRIGVETAFAPRV